MCRVGDDDPRNSASSLQRFAGEDLRLAEQRRAQQAANQAAWAAQHAEHAAAEAAAAAESRTAAQLVSTEGSGTPAGYTLRTMAVEIRNAAQPKSTA